MQPLWRQYSNVTMHELYTPGQKTLAHHAHIPIIGIVIVIRDGISARYRTLSHRNNPAVSSEL